jgi:hypothetical protein
LSLRSYSEHPNTAGDGAAVWVASNRVINYALQNGLTVVASAGKRSADKIGDRQSFGSGMLNVPAALDAARQ